MKNRALDLRPIAMINFMTNVQTQASILIQILMVIGLKDIL